MIDIYSTYCCENCGRKEYSSTGDPMYSIDNITMCNLCRKKYVPISESECDLCNDKFYTELDTWVTTLGTCKVCAPCLDYNLKEDTHILIELIKPA